MTSTLHSRGGASTLGYTETLMYGHYSHLRSFARKEGERWKTKQYATLAPTPLCPICTGRCRLWCHILFSRTVQDLTFLTLLGFMVALLSFAIDVMVDRCILIQRSLFRLTSYSVATQYFAWLLFHLVLICFSTGFTHIVGPTAIGSGIPEVKTIMKGVVLKEYLTLRTLVAKVVGLTASLGSGLPLGKAGPFVHVASVSASVLSKLFPMYRDNQENEARSIALLTAASAVGLSCVFAAPIGGVLFSIEATAIYFAVRNYWRGFYAAICGALIFRLLAIWFQDQDTLTAVFKTTLRHDMPYDVLELIAFLMVGAVCGVFGAIWVWLHRNTVLLIRRQKRLSLFLQRNRFIYPSIITFAIASCCFPPFMGDYMAGGLTLREAVNQMFDNRTWTSKAEPLSFQEARMLQTWKGPWNNVLLTLSMFFINRFWMCAIATTLPVPCGIFIPAFALGASMGRIAGEIMALLFPAGIRGNLILPGAYAIIGAATFSGAVTHTVSPAIIAFEVTGQMSHILPCVMAVMVANATAHYLQPSLYDAMIFIKKLPFLPASINPDACNAHKTHVEDFMIRDLHYLTVSSTYNEGLDLLEHHNFRDYPIVDNSGNMMLVGSIRRSELKKMIVEQLSHHRRLASFDKALALQAGPTTGSVQQNLPEHVQEAPPIKRFSISRVVDENANRTRKISNFSLPGISSSTAAAKLEEKPKRVGIQFDASTESALYDEKKSSQFDLTMLQWEQHQLRQRIDFELYDVDLAPFQITNKTSLYRIHALFSLLSLHHTLVTCSGRLVGIVSLAEVRKSIQGEINKPVIKAPKRNKGGAQDDSKEPLKS